MMTIEQVAAMVRSLIERQVATTPAGKKLSAVDDAAMRNLVTNIVGNLTMAVHNAIEEAAETAQEQAA